MPFITTALAVGLGVTGSVVGGVLAKKGADTQAKAAIDATAMATAEQRRQFDLNRSDLAPWMTAGNQALQQLQFLMGLGVPPQQAQQMVQSQSAPGAPARLGVDDPSLQPGGMNRFSDISALDGRGDGTGRGFGPLPGAPDMQDFQPTVPTAASGGSQPAGAFGSLARDFSGADFQTDPGYDFRLSEGAKALERSAAARGSLFSGGTLKALTQYNQDFASNEFSNAYNRFQTNRTTRYNQLAGIAGVGQQTAQTLAGVNTGISNNIAQTTIAGMTSAAAARASGYNALGNTIGNAANAPLNWLLLSRLNAGGMSGSGGGGP